MHARILSVMTMPAPKNFGDGLPSDILPVCPALRFCGCVRTQRTKRVDARPRFPLPLRFSPRRPQKRHRLSSSGSSPAGSSTDAGGAALIAPAGGWDRPKELSRVGTPYGGWYQAAGSSTQLWRQE